VYVWIWRKLPGGLVGKLLGSLLLLTGAVAVLFLWVFPYAEPRLPFNQTTVEDGGAEPVATPSG
jgi:hypothetical protein